MQQKYRFIEKTFFGSNGFDFRPDLLDSVPLFDATVPVT